jgi:hypothetical protein
MFWIELAKNKKKCISSIFPKTQQTGDYGYLIYFQQG